MGPGLGYFARMDETVRVPRSPFTTRRGFFARFDAWFRESCPHRAERAIGLARQGVRGFREDTGKVVGRVPSSGGGWYTVELRWVGRRAPVTPRGYEPLCPCPDFRPWCKHAMALAYHVTDFR